MNHPGPYASNEERAAFTAAHPWFVRTTSQTSQRGCQGWVTRVTGRYATEAQARAALGSPFKAFETAKQLFRWSRDLSCYHEVAVSKRPTKRSTKRSITAKAQAQVQP